MIRPAFAAAALAFACAASAQTWQIPYTERVFASYNGDGSYKMKVAAPTYQGEPGYMQFVTLQPYTRFYNMVVVERRPGQCAVVSMADKGTTMRQRAKLCKAGDAWADTASPLKIAATEYAETTYTLTVSGLPKLLYVAPPPVTPKPGGTQ